jgi:hypothetical protein
MFDRIILFLQSVALAILTITYGCAPTSLPRRPPEIYQGPVAEGPLLQAGDYWIYSRADGSRMKLGAGTLLSRLEFPLWVGRVWKFDTTAPMRGGPTAGRRTDVEVECVATAFESVTVTAGQFEAFQCKCQCTVFGLNDVYDENCGTWKVWYAPQAKNIVLIAADSTAGSAELQEYKVANAVLESGSTPEKSEPRSAPSARY